MYIRLPLSLRNVEDLLHERGIDICHETVRYWWNKFCPMFASEIRKKRIHPSHNYSNWKWHLDEAFVKVNGEIHYLWRAVDHEGEVLKAFVSRRRDRKAALVLLKKLMRRYGKPSEIVTDRLRSYRAEMKTIGNAEVQEVGRRKNNSCENAHLPFRRREQAMLKFRRLRSQQKFVSLHASVHNHFNTERHLNSRTTFKVQRDVALAEWRQIGAA